jgi:hypothetical protein
MSLSPVKLSVFQWYETPDILKYQIDILSEFLRKDPRVEEEYTKWKNNYKDIRMEDQIFKGQELRKILLLACIFKNISALEVSRTKFFPHLHCYNERGEAIIQLDKKITEGTYVKLFSGHFIHPKFSNGWGDKPIVIKLYESRDNVNTTSYEIDIYRMLGDPSPSLGVNCYLWNIPVLVMKPLESLTVKDDENIVGIHVLQQLPALHVSTTHNDLKPLNIMREPGPGKPKYRMIDFGGCAKERLGNGFKRRTWSSKWTTQKRKGVVTNPKYDLLELGHTLTALKHMRRNKTKRFPNRKKRTFTGRLKAYMDYVEKIDDENIKHMEYGPHYKNLIAILRGQDTESHASSLPLRSTPILRLK